jgi:hypothetical protein
MRYFEVNMAQSPGSTRFHEDKRSQLRIEDEARMEKLRLGCAGLDSRVAKWRYAPDPVKSVRKD